MSDAVQTFSPRERVALALLAVGTVIVLPGALDRFVFLKVAVMAAGTAFAFSCPSHGRLPRRVAVLVSIGAVLLLVATLREPAVWPALLGRAPRYEGVFVLPVYVGTAAAGARLLGPERTPGSTQWFLRWLAVAAVLVGIEAALELSGLRPLATNVARPGSLLGNASDEGAWAVVVLGPLTAVAATTRRWEYFVGAVAAAVTLVASGSRGALIGGVAVAVVLLVLDRRRSVAVIVLAGVVLLALGTFAAPATRSRVIGTSPYSLETVKGRSLLWSETLTLIEHYPVIGVGASDYVNAIPLYHDQQWQRQVGPKNPPDSPHDWILQAAADGGVLLALDAIALGLIVLLGGVATSRRQRTRGERAAVIGMVSGVLGYGVALLFHFTSPGTTPLAAVLAGALVAVAPVHGPELSDHASTPLGRRRWTVPDSRALRVARVTLFFVLAVVLLLAAAAEIPLRTAVLDAANGELRAANHEFHLASALRPWDSTIDATAAHVYAVLGSDGEPGAARRGVSWSASALHSDPDGVESLEDAASIEVALGHLDRAEMTYARATALDPTNSVVLIALGRVELQLGQHRRAAQTLQRALRYAPHSISARHLLRLARQ